MVPVQQRPPPRCGRGRGPCTCPASCEIREWPRWSAPIRADSPSSSISVATVLRKLCARHVGHAEFVADLAPAGTEVVGVAPGAGRRTGRSSPARRGTDRLRRAVSTVTANVGSGMVRRPAAVFVSSIAHQALARSPDHLAGDRSACRPCSSKSAHRRPSSSEIRSPVAMNKVIGSTRSWRWHALGRAQLRQQAAQLVGRQRRRALRPCSSTGSATRRAPGWTPRTFAITARCSPPFRIVLDCTAITSPCARRIDRMAASSRAGVASPTRTPAMIFASSFAQYR